jgi:hypothetical protein
MAYLAGAWLILQVADTVIPWLELGDAVGRILLIVLIVLIVGFVPAVIATWMFEWTPDGIRFDDEVEVDAAGSVVARRRLDRIIIGVLALAVIYFAFDKFLFGDGPAIANISAQTVTRRTLETASRTSCASSCSTSRVYVLPVELLRTRTLRKTARRLARF